MSPDKPDDDLFAFEEDTVPKSRFLSGCFSGGAFVVLIAIAVIVNFSEPTHSVHWATLIVVLATVGFGAWILVEHFSGERPRFLVGALVGIAVLVGITGLVIGMCAGFA